MKKIVCVIIAALIIILPGCVKTEDKTEPDGYTFTDDMGNTVTVNEPKRVAALLGSYADVWMLAGGTVCASADDAWDDFGLDMPEDAVNLGNTKKLNFELLLSAKPDFVIASTNTLQNVEWKSSLDNAGITVAYFDVSDFNDYLRMLKICTDITGKSENYQKYGESLKFEIDEIHQRRENEPEQTVLVMRASATSIRAKNSKNNVLGEMLATFNCVNIADKDKSLLENLSMESIVLQNPDKIFIVQSGDDTEGTKENIIKTLGDDPLWNELDAVKNGKVYYMDKRFFNLKPNAEWAKAYERLEECLYGEAAD